MVSLVLSDFRGMDAVSQAQAHEDRTNPYEGVRLASLLESSKLEAAIPTAAHRSPEEIRELQRVIRLIARVFSENAEIELLPSPLGTWACGLDAEGSKAIHDYAEGTIASLESLPARLFKPKIIFYQLEDLAARPVKEILGVLRHEVGHALHSDFRLLAEGQRFAKEQGKPPMSWMSIANALEDPWINNLEIKDSEAVREQMAELYNRWKVEVADKINSQPVSHQLGLNIIHYWLTGAEIPGIKSAEVTRQFGKIRAACDQFFTGASASENFDLLKKEIWPHYAPLIETALKDEELKELSRRITGSGLGGGSPGRKSGEEGVGSGRKNPGQEPSGARDDLGGGSSAAGGDPGAQAPRPEVSTRLQSAAQRGSGGSGPSVNNESHEDEKGALGRAWERIKELFGVESEHSQSARVTDAGAAETPQQTPSAPAEQGSPHRAALPPQSSQHEADEPDTKYSGLVPPKIAKALAKELGRQEREIHQGNKKRGGEPELPADIDLTALPPDLVDRLKQLAESLPEDLKQELTQEAAKQFQRKEEENLRRSGRKEVGAQSPAGGNGPAAAVPRIESNERKTHAAREAVAEALAQGGGEGKGPGGSSEQQPLQESDLRELSEAILKRDMVRLGFDPKELEHYRRFKELDGAMRGMVVRFIQALERYLPKHQEFQHGGEYFTGSRVNIASAIEKAPIGDLRIFKRREPQDSPDPRMFVQLIIDNSGSMEGEKMEQSLRTAIFWGRVLKEFRIPFSIKLFGQQVTEIMRLEDDYDDPHKRIRPALVQKALANEGHTDMGSPLKLAKAEMQAARKRYPESFGAVFVISDSGANHGLVGQGLKKLITEMQADYMVMNFILSEDAAEVESAKTYFGEQNVVHPKNFQELPLESFRVLRTTLDRLFKATQI